MPYGYTGKILHADLTNGKLVIEEPEEKFYRTYMGGSAMGMQYVLNEKVNIFSHFMIKPGPM